MPIMRRRKFIIQNETLKKETDNNSLQASPQGYEHKILESVRLINKFTSTIDENITKEENHSDNEIAAESSRKKKRCEPKKAGQNVVKPVIHKVKVRNLKHTLEHSSEYRKSAETATDKSENEIENNLSTNAINLNHTVKHQVPRTPAAICRICHAGDSISDFGKLVSACLCKGTIGRVHVVCLETWLTESGKSRCELCSTSYAIRRIHKYGILRALTIWMLSQNSKQLVFDMLGTILMMPLAILAAWLSGTTLLNLMAQEDEMAAWPLVSSFMLSCTTLVCYYCWIVSAATRHVIGWWIWYQSQYVVKLLRTNPEDTEDTVPGNT